MIWAIVFFISFLVNVILLIQFSKAQKDFDTIRNSLLVETDKMRLQHMEEMMERWQRLRQSMPGAGEKASPQT